MFRSTVSNYSSTTRCFRNKTGFVSQESQGNDGVRNAKCIEKQSCVETRKADQKLENVLRKNNALFIHPFFWSFWHGKKTHCSNRWAF